MSIFYADYSCITTPDDIHEIMERYEEACFDVITPDSHKLFTLDELKSLLGICYLAEHQASSAINNATDYIIDSGFSVVSDDRPIIEDMIKQKVQAEGLTHGRS